MNKEIPKEVREWYSNLGKKGLKTREKRFNSRSEMMAWVRKKGIERKGNLGKTSLDK